MSGAFLSRARLLGEKFVGTGATELMPAVSEDYRRRRYRRRRARASNELGLVSLHQNVSGGNSRRESRIYRPIENLGDKDVRKESCLSSTTKPTTSMAPRLAPATGRWWAGRTRRSRRFYLAHCAIHIRWLPISGTRTKKEVGVPGRTGDALNQSQFASHRTCRVFRLGNESAQSDRRLQADLSHQQRREALHSGYAWLEKVNRESSRLCRIACELCARSPAGTPNSSTSASTLGEWPWLLPLEPEIADPVCLFFVS